MSRKSSISKLPPAVKTAVDAALAEGRATIEQIVELIEQMGGQASRSAVGRYKLDFEESLQRYRGAQDAANAWIAQFRSRPDSDVSRLLTEMIKSLAFQTMAQAGTEEGGLEPLQVARLAKAVKDMVGADVLVRGREAEIRKEERERLQASVDGALERVEATPRLSRQEMLKRIREEVYNIVETKPEGGA